MAIHTVLTLVTENEQVLLGFKKRGFGQGLWNGFGGKVERGERAEDAALRELHEEAGLAGTRVKKVAEFSFSFADGSFGDIRMEAFRVPLWIGEPCESEEMRPQWFAFSEVPYEKMWDDDKLWMPRVFEGESLAGSFTFDAGRVVRHELSAAVY